MLLIKSEILDTIDSSFVLSRFWLSAQNSLLVSPDPKKRRHITQQLADCETDFVDISEIDSDDDDDEWGDKHSSVHSYTKAAAPTSIEDDSKILWRLVREDDANSAISKFALSDTLSSTSSASSVLNLLVEDRSSADEVWPRDHILERCV